MKRVWLLTAGLCLVAGFLTAADDALQIFGYYEPQYLGTRLSGKFYQLFANKLRVDLRADLSEHVTFAANFDYITYHGKKDWDVLEFLSPDVVVQIPEPLRPLYIIPFENENFLDNAYLKLSFPGFDLTAGKQQISLGTGYVWNPTDVFNIKDVLDPTYEQPGHNAVRLDVPVGDRYTVTALYSPESTWGESGKLLQVKGNAGRFDFALTFVETNWIFHDYTRFDAARMNFTSMPERRRLLGGSTAGEVLGLGVWAEYAYSWMDKSRDFSELVLGSDYTFDIQTYVMLEYYHNSRAESDYRAYDLNDWMRFYAAEQKSVARHQLFVLVQHPVTDLLTLGIQNIVALSDGSVAVVPTAGYSLSDNVELFAYLNINVGTEGKAYGRNMGTGGLVRMRVYF
jgi:hypothetical protein